MWTYNRSNGALSRGGALVATGYSGNGDGLNNPSMSTIHDVGPIPAGKWFISSPFIDPGKGPLVMRLIPADDTQTWGRGGFLIHGDNVEMDHTASEGCIILGHDVRQQIAMSGDDELEVI
jgi:hypothetical protein